jgi:hypothetical protein
MTEDEAKMKWCPFLQVALVYDKKERTIEERDNRDDTCRPHCIGSECMAWRAIDPPEFNENPHGYCGLAGKP